MSSSMVKATDVESRFRHERLLQIYEAKKRAAQLAEKLRKRRAIENNPGLQVDKVRTLRRLLTRSHNAASTRDLGRAARTAAARRQRRAAARLHRGHRAVKKPAHVGARRRTESQDGVRESRRGEDDDTDSVRPYHEDDFGEVTRPDNPIVRPVSAPTYATPGRESQATAVSASVASTGDSSVDGTNGSTGQKRVRIALLSRQKSRRGATRPKTAHERLSHTPTETFWLKTTQHEQGQGMPARASDPVQEKVIKNHGQHVTPHTPPREIMKLAEAAQTAGSTVKANVLIPRFSYASCVLKGSRTMQGSSACCDATWAEPEFCGNANFATFGVVDGHGLNGAKVARLVSRTLPDMVALSRNFPVSPAVAMCEGFEAAQRMLVEDSGLDVTSSGASALCATVIGNVLWVGHTGDCRACIGRMVVRRIKPDGTLAPDLSDDEKEVQGDGIATDERSKKRYSKLIRDVPPVVAQYIRWPERTAVQDEPPPGCERPWQVIAPRPVSRKKHLRGRFRAVAQVAGGLGAARTRQEEIVAAASLREEVRKKTVARHSRLKVGMMATLAVSTDTISLRSRKGVFMDQQRGVETSPTHTDRGSPEAAACKSTGVSEKQSMCEGERRWRDLHDKRPRKRPQSAPASRRLPTTVGDGAAGPRGSPHVAKRGTPLRLELQRQASSRASSVEGSSPRLTRSQSSRGALLRSRSSGSLGAPRALDTAPRTPQPSAHRHSVASLGTETSYTPQPTTEGLSRRLDAAHRPEADGGAPSPAVPPTPAEAKERADAARKNISAPPPRKKVKMMTIPLTIDHSLERPGERMRIVRSGGRVDMFRVHQGGPAIGSMRVWNMEEETPGLPLSRSLGDVAAAELGVSCIPEVSHHVLQPADKFIILATNGVWQVMDSKTAVEIVSDAILNAWTPQSAGSLLHKAKRPRRSSVVSIAASMADPASLNSRNIRTGGGGAAKTVADRLFDGTGVLDARSGAANKVAGEGAQALVSSARARWEKHNIGGDIDDIAAVVILLNP